VAQHGFRRTPSGRIVLRLSGQERTLLDSLLAQLVELVAPEDPADTDPLAAMVGIATDADAPSDPALARLFPDGYGEEEAEAAADFRRFTERSLREGKVGNARTAGGTLAGAGNKITLQPAEAQAWLSALNDLRLLLGTRLEVADDPSVTDARIALLTSVAFGTAEAGEDRAPGGDPEDERGGDPDGEPGARRLAMAELSAYHLYDWLTFLQGSLIDAVSGVDLTPPDRRVGE
jgi:hypothetical protein